MNATMTSAMPGPALGTAAPSAAKPPKPKKNLFDPAIVRGALKDSFIKLDPRTMVRNPVMFVVEVGSLLCTILFFRDLNSSTGKENLFAGLVSAWLWFTVLFANFARRWRRVGARPRPHHCARPGPRPWRGCVGPMARWPMSLPPNCRSVTCASYGPAR